MPKPTFPAMPSLFTPAQEKSTWITVRFKDREEVFWQSISVENAYKRLLFKWNLQHHDIWVYRGNDLLSASAVLANTDVIEFRTEPLGEIKAT